MLLCCSSMILRAYSIADLRFCCGNTLPCSKYHQNAANKNGGGLCRLFRKALLPARQSPSRDEWNIPCHIALFLERRWKMYCLSGILHGWKEDMLLPVRLDKWIYRMANRSFSFFVYHTWHFDIVDSPLYSSIRSKKSLNVIQANP